MAISRVWSLTPATRWSIVLFVVGYLCATHPWSGGERSAGHYELALAFLLMAAFPRGTRLAVAVGTTLGVIVLVILISNVLGNS